MNVLCLVHNCSRKATYLNNVPLVNTVSLESVGTTSLRSCCRDATLAATTSTLSSMFKGAGRSLGPGQWVTVTGDARSFSNPVTTLTGQTIDLETYGLERLIGWHLMTIILAVAWLGFWLVPRPFLGRLLLVEKGAEEELITDRDRQVGLAFLIVAVLLVAGGYYTSKRGVPGDDPPAKWQSEHPAVRTGSAVGGG